MARTGIRKWKRPTPWSAPRRPRRSPTRERTRRSRRSAVRVKRIRMITNRDRGVRGERRRARGRARRPFPLAPETNRSGGGGRLAPAFLFFRRGERMHRTNRVPYQAFAGLLAGLLLASLPQ